MRSFFFFHVWIPSSPSSVQKMFDNQRLCLTTKSWKNIFLTPSYCFTLFALSTSATLLLNTSHLRYSAFSMSLQWNSSITHAAHQDSGISYFFLPMKSLKWISMGFWYCVIWTNTSGGLSIHCFLYDISVCVSPNSSDLWRIAATLLTQSVFMFCAGVFLRTHSINISY